MFPELRANDEVTLRMNINDVRQSHFIKFMDHNRVAVSQTQPPMDSHLLMSLIFFTYCPDKQKKERLGFQARLEEITPDQQIIIRRLTKPFVCDLRLWPRIHFDLLPHAHAYVQNKELHIVDVSVGGTQWVLQESDPASPSVGSLVAIKFIFDQGETTADGKIMNLWTDPEGLRHIEVKFFGEPEIRDFIYKKS